MRFKSPRIFRSLGASILILFLGNPGPSSLFCGEEPPSSALRNEDVVRMMVAGRTVSSIREAIETRKVDFDLSEEMEEELRLAGIPESLLKAMRTRQNEMEKKRAAPLALAPARVSVLAVKLKRERPFLLVSDRLSTDQARTLQVGSTDAERAISDVAFFLACRTPEHVPDRWRSASPLGRDFVAVPRHQMLDFRQGATAVAANTALGRTHAALPNRTEEAGKGGLLRLDIPEELRAELASGTLHDLLVGIAVRVGDRFLAIAQDQKDGVIAGADTPLLDAEITGLTEKSGPPLLIRFIEAGGSVSK